MDVGEKMCFFAKDQGQKGMSCDFHQQGAQRFGRKSWELIFLEVFCSMIGTTKTETVVLVSNELD